MLKPILVTGTHRSGTTWIGRILATCKKAGFLYEPFSNARPPGLPIPGLNSYYYYPLEGTRSTAGRCIINVAKGKIPFPLLFRASSPGELKHVTKQWGKTLIMNRMKKFLVLKAPEALFFAPLIHHEANAKVVVLTRHPAAFICSNLRMNWSFSFRDILNHGAIDRLVDGQTLDLIRSAEAEPFMSRVGIIRRTAACWLMTQDFIAKLKAQHGHDPNWSFLRLEDIVNDPGTRLRELCNRLQLDYSSEVENFVQQSTTETRNPFDKKAQHVLFRDSKSTLKNWTHNLEKEEIEYIREKTFPGWSPFYKESDWN